MRYENSPDDSLRNSHQLKQGDYLIISSDGLFDNLYEDEIAMIVQEHVTSGESAATAITSDLLDSACQVLVHKASKGTKFVFYKINSPILQSKIIC